MPPVAGLLCQAQETQRVQTGRTREGARLRSGRVHNQEQRNPAAAQGDKVPASVAR